MLLEMATRVERGLEFVGGPVRWVDSCARWEEIRVFGSIVSREQFVSAMYEFAAGSRVIPLGGSSIQIPDSVCGMVGFNGHMISYSDFVDQGMRVVAQNGRCVDGAHVPRDMILSRFALPLFVKYLKENLPDRNDSELINAHDLVREAENGGIRY